MDDRTCNLSDAETCAHLARSPSAQFYDALKIAIQQSSRDWLHRYVGCGGLSSMLESMVQLASMERWSLASSRRPISDAVLQLDCLDCLRALLSRHDGLQMFIDDQMHVDRLVQCIDSDDCASKKQLFDLLTLLCVHSRTGHQRVVSALHQHKRAGACTHWLSVVMVEMTAADSAKYKTSVLAFINALLHGFDDVVERCRVREQLLAGSVCLDYMHNIKKLESDPDLAIQIQVFLNAKHNDDTQLERSRQSNLSCLDSMFELVTSKVSGDDRSCFLSILQDLSLLVSTNSQHRRSQIWRILMDVVKHISTTDNIDELIHLYKVSRDYHATKDKVEADDRESVAGVQCAVIADVTSASCAAEAEGRRDSGISVTSSLTTTCLAEQGAPVSAHQPAILEEPSCEVLLLSEEDSQPFSKVSAVLPWITLPADQVADDSIWKCTRAFSSSTFSRLNSELIRSRFITQQTFFSLHKIELLTGDSSLALNILLAQHKFVPKELVTWMTQGNVDSVGAGTLKLLINSLPSDDEIRGVSRYCGPLDSLTPASRLIFGISRVDNYRLVLDRLGLQADFKLSYERLKTDLAAKLDCCNAVLNSATLRRFAHLMLQVGNVLNENTHLSAAPAVKLSSWKSIVHVHSNKPHGNLLSYLIRLLERHDRNALAFLRELASLQTATRRSLQDLTCEISSMSERLNVFCNHLQQLGSARFSSVFGDLCSKWRQQMRNLNDQLVAVAERADQLALYFSEDKRTFSLHHCFVTLYDFLSVVEKTRKEIVVHRQLNMLTAGRSKELDADSCETEATEAFNCNIDGANDANIVDRFLRDVFQGRFFPRQSDLCLPASPIIATAKCHRQGMKDCELVLSSPVIHRSASTALTSPAPDYHNASTPLKSGVRIYRRLVAADVGGGRSSSTAAVNCGSQRRQTSSQINTLRTTDSGRGNDVNGGLRTAFIDDKPDDSDRRVCPLADDVKVSDKETILSAKKDPVAKRKKRTPRVWRLLSRVLMRSRTSNTYQPKAQALAQCS